MRMLGQPCAQGSFAQRLQRATMGSLAWVALRVPVRLPGLLPLSEGV